MCDSRQPDNGAGSEVDQAQRLVQRAELEHELHGGAAGSFRSEGCELCPPDSDQALWNEALDEGLRQLDAGEIAPDTSFRRLEDTVGRPIAGPIAEPDLLEALNLDANATTLERAAELLREPYLRPSPGAAHDCEALAGYLRREAKKMRSGA